MYCRNCGNKLKDSDKICVACGVSIVESVEKNMNPIFEGNSNKLSESKTKKTTILCIVSILICVVSVIVLLAVRYFGSAEDNSKVLANKDVENSEISLDTNDIDDLEYLQGVNFDESNYTCLEYVTIESDGIKSIMPNIYIPVTGTYIYEEGYLPVREDRKVISKKIVELNLNGITFSEEVLGATAYGEYYMTGNSSDDVLVKKYMHNILGQESERVEMICLDRTFESVDGSIVASPPYNYTVSVKAGTFENCVCMLNEFSNDEFGKDYTASYYAPLIGKVLELGYSDFYNQKCGIEWYLMEELISVENEDNDNTNEENVNQTYDGNVELKTDNIIEFSNGLRVIIPVSWVGKVVASENNTSYSIYEAQNYEQGNWEFGPPGRLFDVLLVFNYSEVDASPNHSVLGYFYDGNMAIGMIVDYPTDISYDPENEKLSDAYLEIADSLQEVQFDISGIEGFVECDEDELRSVLSE